MSILKSIFNILLSLFKSPTEERISSSTEGEIPEYVTVQEYLNKHGTISDLSPTELMNMSDLLLRINQLRHKYGKPFILTSGWRPLIYNTEIGGAPNSAHISCQAVDILDKDGALIKWLLEHQNLLSELDLYMERPDYTVGWVHLQSRPTRSGKHIFIP